MVTATKDTLPPLTGAEPMPDIWPEVVDKLGPEAAALFKTLGFTPHRRQLEILAEMEWFTMVAGGLQAGKTSLACVVMVIRYFQDLVRVPDVPFGKREYWLCGDRMEDCIYEYELLKTFFTTLDLLKDVKSNPPRIILDDKWETIIKVKFTSDVANLSGVSPLGEIGCEGAHISKLAYDTMELRRAGRDAWMYISGTFEQDGSPWYKSRFKELLLGEERAKAFKMASYDNEELFPGGKNNPKIQEQKRKRSDRHFMERIEGTPVPPLGLVYKGFDLDLHVMYDYEYQPDQTLYIWSDPGFNSITSVLFAQWYGGCIYVFDEIFARGLTTHQVIHMAQQRPWWKNRSKRLANDPWYAPAHHGGNTSIDEIWQQEGGLVNYAERHKIEERVERVKQTFLPNPETGGAYIRIARHCAGLLSELGACANPVTGDDAEYIYDIDDNGEQKDSKPIDKHNHACDALGIGLMDILGPVLMPYDEPEGHEAPVSTIESRGDLERQLQMSWNGPLVAAQLGLTGAPMPEPPQPGIYYPAVSTPESRGEAWY